MLVLYDYLSAKFFATKFFLSTNLTNFHECNILNSCDSCDRTGRYFRRVLNSCRFVRFVGKNKFVGKKYFIRGQNVKCISVDLYSRPFPQGAGRAAPRPALRGAGQWCAAPFRSARAWRAIVRCRGRNIGDSPFRL